MSTVLFIHLIKFSLINSQHIVYLHKLKEQLTKIICEYGKLILFML